MTNDNSKTALAVLRNTEVRDRSTRTRARRLSGTPPQLGFDEARVCRPYGHGAVRVHADAGAGRPSVRNRRARGRNCSRPALLCPAGPRESFWH